MSGIFILNEVDNFIFIQNTINKNNKLILSISKINAEIILLNEESSNQIYMNNHYSIYGIMGIVNICSVPCLIIITKALDFTKGYNKILKIIEIKHIILNKNIDNQKKIDIETNFKNYSENIIYLPIFFSNEFDLSNPNSKTTEEKNNFFLYNLNMLEPLLSQKNDMIISFCCKCIHGYIGFFNRKLKYMEIKFYFISRKNIINQENDIYQNEIIFDLSNGDQFSIVIYSSFNNSENNPFNIEEMNKLNIISSTFLTDNMKLLDEEIKKNYISINIDQENVNQEIEKIGYNFKKTTQFFSTSYFSENCLQKSDCIIVSGKINEMIQLLKIVIFQNILNCFQQFNIPTESQTDFYVYFNAVKETPKKSYLDLINDTKINLELNRFISELNDNIEKKIEENKKSEISNFINEKKEIDINTLKLYILTFNLGAASSDYVKTDRADFNIENLLFPEQHKDYFTNENSPDFYCIGFQEIVELNIQNIIFKSNNSSVNPWIQKITNILFNKFNYQLIAKTSMVGILLLIYTKSSLVPLINELNISTCKTGFAMGMLGNKGYCICQFNLKGKYFGFCSGHLCSGETKVNLEQRQKELKSIFEFTNHNFKINKFISNDYFFIFGDLNFRVDFSKEDISKDNSIKKSDISLYKDVMFKKDELYNFIKDYEFINEEEVKFFPTYKFIKHSDKYDFSKKLSAWTDRILFGKSESSSLNPIFYDAIYDINISDHRPVSSLFEIKINNK